MVAAFLGTSDLQGKAESEQKREDRIEFPFDEKMNKKMADLIYNGFLARQRLRHKPIT